MSRRDSLYLNDIITACNKIIRRTENITYGQWEDDDVLYDATIRQLTIIGEAMTQISIEVQQQHPGVAWRDIRFFRNIIIHRYFRIENQILWNVINQDVPVLLTQISTILTDLEQSSPGVAE